MSFITDKQTLDDLNLTGKFKAHSVFSIFNQVQTPGGERLLEAMFREPLTNAELINARSEIFRYYQQQALVFPFRNTAIAEAENYLGMYGGSHFLLALAGVYRGKLEKMLVRGERFDQLQRGVIAVCELLHTLRTWLQQLEQRAPYPQPEELLRVRQFLATPRMQWLEQVHLNTGLLPLLMARCQHLLLHVFRKEMEMVLQCIYHIDVYVAVSTVARKHGFDYAQAVPMEQLVFRTTALWHPGLEKAVANPLAFDEHQNLLFLTGANMAGKSTFMKSFGIAVYLAHMGFPVAARGLVFSVRDGLFTSINVPDNLNMGYSHFYAEVLRVKQVATAVASGQNLVVIFDELFKGTNVKDAYDATLSVTTAFAEYRNCFFIISTHIIEVGAALRNAGSNIGFCYLPTVMNGTRPRYTYRLEEGITNDRQGMLIIEQEGIVSLLGG